MKTSFCTRQKCRPIKKSKTQKAVVFKKYYFFNDSEYLTRYIVKEKKKGPYK